MKLILLSFSILIVCGNLFSQNIQKPSWSAEYSKSKSFIENKGQFDENENLAIGKIKYAIDFGATRIFFGDKGISYSFLEANKIPKEERDELRLKMTQYPADRKKYERLIGKFLFKTDVINMTWGQSSPTLLLNGEDETREYHNYSYRDENGAMIAASNAKGFRKLTYKNIYPNIDIEYVVHPIIGVKYAIIVHPGADPSSVSMNFDRDLSILEGKLNIPTNFGPIIDHAPYTFYETNKDQIIPSKYVQNQRQIFFELGDYDQAETIVIDPWTQTPAFNTDWDVVWECEKDNAGNVYILGGIMPLQILKYNSTGVLQWTYSTPYDTSNVWLGTFAVDNSGNSYVTAGSAAQIQKVSSTGALVWNNSNPGGLLSLTEFWSIAFNCDQTKLVIGGTDGFAFGGPKPYVFDLNMSTGNVITSVQVHESVLFNDQEIRSIIPCNNSKYYYLTQDTIGYIYQNFAFCPSTPNAFHATNGINLGYKCENYRYDNSGIMALAHYNGFVFVHRGNQIQKRNFATAAIVATANIPGGIYASGFGNSVGTSGIDIDDCGNIYVGSGNSVIKFDQNLTQTGSYVTAFNVYDLEVSTSGNIIACGGTGNSNNLSRSGGIQSFAASACAPQATICCDATFCIPADLCFNSSPVQLTAATPGGTWSGVGVNASGLFSPAIAGIGTHLITYTLGCGSETISILVGSCSTLQVCEETNGNMTVSGGTGPYTWTCTVTTSTTSNDCVTCGGFVLPIIGCVNATLPCTIITTSAVVINGTNVTLPANTTSVSVADNGGTSLVFDPNTVFPCSSSCPTLSITTTVQTNVLCNGNSTGSATVSASGGLAPYTYTWVSGSLNGPTQTNLAAGAYTINVVDANLCPGSTTVTITQPAALDPPTATITQPTCISATGIVSVTAPVPTVGTSFTLTGITPVVAAQTNTNGIFNPLTSGNYTLIVTIAGCNSTPTPLTLIPQPLTPSAPTPSLIQPTCIVATGTVTVSVPIPAAGTTYTLTGTAPVVAAQTNTTGVFTGLASGDYSLITTVGGCTSTATLITINGQPANPAAPTSSVTTLTTCAVPTGTITVTVPAPVAGTTYTVTGTSPVVAAQTNATGVFNGLTVGTYDVITTVGGCTSTASVIVISPPAGAPTISLTSSTDVTCFNDNDGAAVVSGSGGTGGLTYAWTPTGGTSASATGLTAGNYTATVTDGVGCSSSLLVTIGGPTQILITETVTDIICGSTNGQITTSVSGGSGTYTYAWTPNGETTSSISNLTAGNYSLTVTDGNGCSSTESYTVVATGSLSIVATPVSTTIQEGESVQLSAAGGTSYSWTPSNGLSCTDCANPIATPSSTTIYTVTGTDASGCIGTDNVTIVIQVICGEVYAPTVFSPNGSGPDVNNTQCVYGTCISELSYAIYNRWGEKVFETTDPLVCWDGTYKGKPMNSGVFAYKLVVTLFDGTTVEESGNLTLIR